jgi:hypothetical protein
MLDPRNHRVPRPGPRNNPSSLVQVCATVPGCAAILLPHRSSPVPHPPGSSCPCMVPHRDPLLCELTLRWPRHPARDDELLAHSARVNKAVRSSPGPVRSMTNRRRGHYTRQGNASSSNGHTHQEPQALARAVLQDLLREQSTYGFSLDQTGPYAHGLRILERVRERNGREPARRTLTDLQINEALLRHLLADPPRVSAETSCDSPELPAHVKANQSLSRSASPLLDGLIAFFQEWCTRSYEGYHEAVAIWVLSTLAARRVVLRWRTGVWPILYLLLVSESTAHPRPRPPPTGRWS